MERHSWPFFCIYLILIEAITVVELASWPCLDLAFTLPDPLLDLAMNLPWPCLKLALTLPWPCLDLALTLPWPFPNLASTLHWLCLDLALTLPWPCPHNICPCDICPHQEYLSFYWPDFDETLQVGSWEHLEKIATVTVTFVQATFVLVTFVHIRNISAVTDTIWTKL